MATTYIITGGNVGNPQATLEQVKMLIAAQSLGKITAASSVYQTNAWGMHNQPDFLNQVLKLETPLPAEELLQKLLDIEIQLGRKRMEKNGPRTIDIDILFYEEAVINKPDLVIPHPLLQERRFVLVPLHDIAPALLHPVLKKTVSQLLDECADPLHVNKFSAVG